MKTQELINKLVEANHYYAKGHPIITDQAYDQLWQQLHFIDPTCPILYHTGHNQDLPKGRCQHKHQIFGTQKAFEMPELKPFLERFGSEQLVLEPKYDGCAAVFYRGPSDNSHKLILEGNGKTGADITHHLSGINLTFKPSRSYEVCEIIIPQAKWSTDFGSNVRNVTAGWIASKTLPHKNILELVSHNHGAFQKDYLYDGNLDNFFELLLTTYNEWSAYYRIDGIMIKVKSDQRRLIANNNGVWYNWSIAWKPPIETAKTVCTKIEWNVSRKGRIIPTVIYEPIKLCDTVNQRVTGNNAKWLKDRDIKPGSVLTIGKAGSIIPKIIKVENPICSNELSQTKQALAGLFSGQNTGANVDDRGADCPSDGFLAKLKPTLPTPVKPPVKTQISALPETCPECKNPLKWHSVHLLCDAPNCIAKTLNRLTYFYSFHGMDLKTIGENKIEALRANEEFFAFLQSKPWALLDPIKYDISAILKTLWTPGVFLQYLKNLKDLSGTKNVIHFITSFGYTDLNYTSAEKIYYHIKFKKRLYGVTQKAKESYVTYWPLINMALQEIENFKILDPDPLPDMLYCITGTLSQTREEMIKYFRTKGWHFHPRITKEIQCLIVGDDPGKNKIKTAEKYDIQILSEQQILDHFKTYQNKELS